VYHTFNATPTERLQQGNKPVSGDFIIYLSSVIFHSNRFFKLELNSLGCIKHLSEKLVTLQILYLLAKNNICVNIEVFDIHNVKTTM